MSKKVFHLIIAVVLIVGMAGGGVCEAHFLSSEKAPCGGAHHPDGRISAPASTACHVLPCRGNPPAFRYLPPQPLFRRQLSADGIGAAESPLAAVFRIFSPASSPGLRGVKPILKQPPPLMLPPLFTLHCCLIR